MSTTSKPTSSEDIVGRKYDQCLADLILKTGIGFGAGVVASVILFRRRTWPIALTTGFGAGIAYADCDRSFNPARLSGYRVIPQSEAPPSK
ncbi:hypothetical protein CC1G_10338 [Coprinopsis cinerea okayama7|uniref:MICOS complex subunit MIC10 n=1 Tax=Coprinopsis cinerea (strain Okayama-7 / 130 / ATCC MYA-4618 / FGSC 9003) TaxID=240176 RepID=A8P0L0_COPC7|nr:hypothetical protein CC1G_10338 [Coprinopsis cinerea okayama7\|eukprot:XP_001837917.1 hypothetical protein CC1G_10338 [Coprinopsis cinerea okayama7\